MTDIYFFRTILKLNYNIYKSSKNPTDKHVIFFKNLLNQKKIMDENIKQNRGQGSYTGFFVFSYIRMMGYF